MTQMSAPARKVPLEDIPVRPGLTKDEVAELFDLRDYMKNERSGILLDLYFNCLAYASTCGFTTEKTSTFLAIVKAVHVKAVSETQTIANSFGFFKLLATQSSVQRPPYSLGIFSFAEMKEMSEYMLSTYYRHYKIYQYAFTTLVRMDVQHVEPLFETSVAFEPLGFAMTEEEYDAKQEEIARLAAEAKAKEEEEAAALEEEEREARLKAEYEAAMPEEVTTKVAEVLAASMAQMKEELEAKFAEQEQTLLAKIAALEAK